MKFRKVSIEDALKGAKQNDWKFTAERNGKYNIYFPTGESTTTAKVHEWRTGGKFQSVACTDEPDCKFCAVEKDGWEVYRKQIDAAIAGLDPVLDKDEIHKKKMELVPRITSQTYVYQLVAVVAPDNTWALKIMRLSQKRLEDFNSYAEETAKDGKLLGSTLVLKYPDEENARDRGKNMQILPGKEIPPFVIDEIQEKVAEFNWESALSNFYEFRDMSEDDVAKAIASAGYEAVDEDDEEEIPFVEDSKDATPAPAPATTPADDGDDDGGDDGLDALDDIV